MINEFRNPLGAEEDNDRKKLVVWLGMGVYVMVLFLTVAHNLNLIGSAVNPDLRWIAYVGVAALELNAIALPLALHYWAVSGIHRGATMAFYVVDLLILFANSVVDSGLVTNGSLPPWGAWYLDNFAQASPLMALFMWAMLFMLDPASQSKEKVKRMIAHAQLSALESAQPYLASDNFKSQVEQYGDTIAQAVVKEAFATKGQLPKPRKTDDKVLETTVVARRNGDKNF